MIVLSWHATNLNHSLGIGLRIVELLDPHGSDIHLGLKMRYSILGRRDQMQRGVEVSKVDIPGLLIFN